MGLDGRRAFKGFDWGRSGTDPGEATSVAAYAIAAG
jgi:hypothetical protein